MLIKITKHKEREYTLSSRFHPEGSQEDLQKMNNIKKLQGRKNSDLDKAGRLYLKAFESNLDLLI